MTDKRFGIRVVLPEGDAMAKAHLLENLEYFRWFASERRRDREFEQMQERYVYLRSGDNQTQVLTKVER
ncbi:MAG: hypothetical protein DWQ09_01575 [Proteobacteria bacterium]|nr:MAG: hypothetical protein DWQ09_01575 [Pseudomonadota bacterium]QKK10272.1 MAG: hypothetical protein HND59_00255 [Pseudomonadota bacterium]